MLAQDIQFGRQFGNGLCLALAGRTLRVQAAHQQPTLQPPRRAFTGKDAQRQDKQAREGGVIHRRFRDETECRDPHGPRNQQAGKVKQG